MFKHPSQLPTSTAEQPSNEHPSVEEKIGIPTPPVSGVEEINPRTLHELLEKNLKWSQIIYEQNRKISRKLLWTAVAGWLRVFILLAPLIIALIFLPPLWKEFKEKYGAYFNITTPATGSSGTGTPTNSAENIINILPLTPVQREQLKAMLK